MNIIVTGCAGFIGSRVAELLLNEEHTVYGVDNIDSSYDRRLKQWRLDRLESYDNFVFENTDITDEKKLSELFRTILVKNKKELDAVINLAAKAGVRRSIDEPAAYYRTNLIGVLNLLELCRQFKINKFVQASTSSVYGGNDVPFSEHQKTDRQLSPYASSKKSAELLCYTYHSLYGTDMTVLRYFTVYGPAGRPDMSPFRFIKWTVEGEDISIYGDGGQMRDFTYVDDVARGTILGLGEQGYKIINLGSNRPVELAKFLEIIQTSAGKKSNIVYGPVNPADVMVTWADISAAKELLGWKPAVSLEDGISRSVDWYVQNRDWAKKILL